MVFYFALLLLYFRHELHHLKLTKYLNCTYAFSVDAHYFIVYLTILIGHAVGNRLLPKSLFTFMPLIYLLALNMLAYIFLAIRDFSEAKSSVKRIQVKKNGKLILYFNETGFVQNVNSYLSFIYAFGLIC